jgi:asparagine synthase (glutamine-hydrolysing)
VRSPGSLSHDRWHFAVSFSPSETKTPDKAAFYSDGVLTIEADNVYPNPRHYQVDRKDHFFFGHPIANGNRDDRAVLAVLKQSEDLATNVGRLNGSFILLVYDSQKRKLTLANDRFAAFGLQFCNDGRTWQATSSLKWLWDHNASRKGLDQTSVAQFLFLRRIFGERTLAKGVRYLLPASILHVDQNGRAREHQYWRPDYARDEPSDRELPSLIAEGLRRAVAAHQSDDVRYGLLLSGGLDSRALLAASQKPIACYTTCLRENNESAVARTVAGAAGASFHFVLRPRDLYDKNFEDAVFLTGGQQTYVEAQFLGYENAWPELPDTMFIGLGLDIFFGGLYLPKAPVEIFGRPALHFRLKTIAKEFSAAFLDGVSYRLKQSDPNAVIKQESRRAVRDLLRESLDSVASRGRELGADDYDLWEYMHIDTLSRHYSFPMMMSVRSYAECRAPALDNDLFDLSVRMTARQKVNGTAYQRAIALLSPALGKIRNANTNLPATMPLPQQTLMKAIRFGAHRMLGTPYPKSPGREDRSWPSDSDNLAACPSIIERARKLPQSERLAEIQFVDMDGVRSVVDDHFDGRADHAVLINLLITLDSFMRVS